MSKLTPTDVMAVVNKRLYRCDTCGTIGNGMSKCAPECSERDYLVEKPVYENGRNFPATHEPGSATMTSLIGAFGKGDDSNAIAALLAALPNTDEYVNGHNESLDK